MTGLLVCAPMRMEAKALRRGSDHLTVLHTGTGPRAKGIPGQGPLVVAGIGGGLAAELKAGDVVVASEVRTAGRPPLIMSNVTRLAEIICQLGLTVHTGPVVSCRKIVHGSARDRLAATGASIVDTESYWLLRDRDPAGSWCVRVVADAVAHRVLAPRTLQGIRTALGRLPAVGAALAKWDNESTVREVRADGGTAAAGR